MSAIVIKDLAKTYANGKQALKGVSLEIEKGDFFALLGPNGAGKTTIIGILTGLVNKTAGSVSVFGLDLDRAHNQIKRLIGVVPQEFNFSIFEKVFDIVVWQAGYFGIPRKIAEERAEKVLKKLELWDKKDQPSRALSGGMKRRLMIARALVHEPEFLILDEPTAGVDVELRRGMWQYLRELNAQGTTILLTTHYLEEAEELCRHVAIIKQGEIVKKDSIKNVISSLEIHTLILTTSPLPENIKLATITVRRIDDVTLEADLTHQTVTELVEELKSLNIAVQDIRAKGNRLETFFLNLLNQ
ncbi:MAG: ABC transporter ATP-binding protein [Candidatus Abawacabacteria bacterium]|nr:ABC transporter ATP-binding protein [Candidatus Abawacabacteria bacterium]